MENLIKHKHYSFILFGAKSLGIAIIFMIFLFAMTKSAGTPFNMDKLAQVFLQKEYDIKVNSEQGTGVVEMGNNPSNGNEKGILIKTKEDIPGAVMSIMDDNSSVEKLHGVADNIDNNTFKNMTNKICKSYPEECQILFLEGNFTEQERYIYTLLSVYFMSKIDANLKNRGRSLFGGFQKLTLRSNLSHDKSEGTCYASRRGCSDHHTLLINLELIKTPEEYAGVLVHELSHIVDLGVVVGNSKKKDKVFTEFGKPVFSIDDPSILFYSTSWKGENIRKKGAKKEDFVSLYGMTNPFEDIAEAGITYKMHNAYFRVLAQTNRSLYKKYQRRSNVYGGKYIFADGNNAMKAKANPNKRVWDMTKMNK